MTLFRLHRVAPKLLLMCIAVAVAGCHRSQSAQNTQNPPAQSSATNAQSQPATQPATTSETAAPPSTPDSNAAPSSSPSLPSRPAAASRPAPARRSGSPAPAAASSSTQPAQQANNAPPQPAPVVVPEGTTLRIRINQHISVKTSHAGDDFDGTIVDAVIVKGDEVIPAGSLAQGRVVESKRRGRFKGRSVLELKLVGLDVNGRHYRLDTSTVARTKKGKGKRTAAFIGGGTGVGMLIGGVASGGVGLLIGGLTGAGAGTLGAAFTGNRDIDIPAETVMSFRLDQPIQLQ
ncbi:MAG: hypothetical protein JOZ33_09590 [Acidobacteriaceae bacterium]|nr:hypothetical protein [Acidobacteriaceae bacterium]